MRLVDQFRLDVLKSKEMEGSLEQLRLTEDAVAPFQPYDDLIVRSLTDPEQARERQLLFVADNALESFVLDPESVLATIQPRRQTNAGLKGDTIAFELALSFPQLVSPLVDS